jgi:hypothetical protein
MVGRLSRANDWQVRVLSERQQWAVVGGLAGALGAFAMRNGLETAWKLAVGDDPPKNPAARDVPWRHAILWTVATGVLIGLGRMLAERAAAEAWDRYQGRTPPV